MEFVYIGKIVNTHGIKGEIRIISDFEKKDIIFTQGFSLYAGKEKTKMVIDSYRKHKNYDMILFNKIIDIKDVLPFKGLDVYVKRCDLNLKDDEYLMTDLIGLNAYYDNKLVGCINIEKNGMNFLIEINDKLIPYNKHFIKSVNIEKKEVILQNVEGLL